MRRTTWTRAALAAATLLAVAGCSTPDASSPSAAPPPSAPASAPGSSAASPAGADLTVAKTSLGDIVVDSKGLTVYYFDKDQAGSGRSVCSGDCLVAWPAVVPAGSTPTAEGLSAEVGVITRDDGTKQVTIAGRPVYLFAKDAAPGDVTGQGVGKVWYVVGADGAEITKAASS